MAPPEESPSAESHSIDEIQSAIQFVGFELANQKYAFPIEKIQEIIIVKQVTQVPQVPDYVEGVSNLRGTIIPVINLRSLFGIPTVPNDENTRIIVLNVGSRTMGCSVDSVSQVIKISNDCIQPAPEHVAPQGCHYVTGFANHEDSLVILLDVEELMEPDKLEAVHQAAIIEANSNERESK